MVNNLVHTSTLHPQMTVELPGWYSLITNELTSSLPRGNMGEVSGEGSPRFIHLVEGFSHVS